MKRAESCEDATCESNALRQGGNTCLNVEMNDSSSRPFPASSRRSIQLENTHLRSQMKTGHESWVSLYEDGIVKLLENI